MDPAVKPREVGGFFSYEDSTVFCLMGPTASGKTDLACELVQKFPLEIISVDSAMIYRGMDIGTAKPTPQELAQAPHHLIDILDPPASFSAAQFCEAVEQLIPSIRAKGKWPLLVGGTMMYFHALQQGLSKLPEADPLLRNQLLEKAKNLGWDALHDELSKIDPKSGLRIHPHDTQRIQRALEVYYASGKPLSVLQAEDKNPQASRFINIAIFPEQRAELHKRIAQRFNQMLQMGFVEEVKELLFKWQLPESCPAMRCVGYRQGLEYLQGKTKYPEFCDKAVAATRQLAKRQLTWIRNSQVLCFDYGMQSKILDMIEKLLDNTAPS
jgi:tRNA dimethylallyltransferase